MSEATKGVESVVLVTVEPRGGQTKITLRHSGVPDMPSQAESIPKDKGVTSTRTEYRSRTTRWQF